MKNLKGACIFGQSGGPTAVINSSIAGVYKQAKELGVETVYGMVYGIEGLLEENIIDLDEYLTTDENIELIAIVTANGTKQQNVKVEFYEEESE